MNDTEHMNDTDDTEDTDTLQTETSIAQITPIFKLIHNLKNRIVYMSATPRLFETLDCELTKDVFGNIDYTYEMGEAIRNGLICDYNIYLPLIVMKEKRQSPEHSLPQVPIELNEFMISYSEELVLQVFFILRASHEIGSNKCIVYLSSIAECVEFQNALNKINQDYFYNENIFVEQYTSDTTYKDRQTIINNFRNFQGKAFILSIRILDECIDIIECDSIFITKPSDNKVRNIQRICRANRKDKKNPHKVSSIYVWSFNELESSIEIIKHLKEFDNSFTINKVNLINTYNIENNNCLLRRNNDNQENNYTADYDILDNFIIGIKKCDTWYETLERVKDYIQINNKIPSTNDKNKDIKRIGIWLSHQKTNYKKELHIMKNPEIKKAFEDFMNEYRDYFKSNKEIWYCNLNNVKKYIQTYNKIPSTHDKNPDIKTLGKWLSYQKTNYNKELHIMKNSEIKKAFEDFMNEYGDYFKSNEEIWYCNLNNVKQYIQINNKRPSEEDKNPDIKRIGKWLSNQKKNYKKEKDIMKNPEIRKEFEDFMNEFLNRENGKA